MKDRIYVCHTFYHIMITFMKEFALGNVTDKKADIVLGWTSTDFTGVADRLRACGTFGEVYDMDEKIDVLPELTNLKKDRGNVFFNLIQRIIFTSKRSKMMESRVPVDFKQYKDVYVYCDNDPIGTYLAKHHIYYHAFEDGLNCLEILDAAHYDNRGHFGIKKWMSEHNLIHIQNGYSKYCLDMEINDETNLKFHCPKYVVVPRAPLEERLTSSEKAVMVKAFIPDSEKFLNSLQSAKGKECVLLLTMPYPADDEIRKQICADIIRDYCEGYHVVIKPHPREKLDYVALRPDCTVIQGKFPVEILNYVEGIHFAKAITIVSTALDSIDFCDEKIRLGEDFWDTYEDPALHKYNAALKQK